MVQIQIKDSGITSYKILNTRQKIISRKIHVGNDEADSFQPQ